jgi:hypothetical protein
MFYKTELKTNYKQIANYTNYLHLYERVSCANLSILLMLIKLASNLNKANLIFYSSKSLFMKIAHSGYIFFLQTNL